MQRPSERHFQTLLLAVCLLCLLLLMANFANPAFEWDIATRSYKARELISDGPWQLFIGSKDYVWLPGHTVTLAVLGYPLHRLTGELDVHGFARLAEAVSAISITGLYLLLVHLTGHPLLSWLFIVISGPLMAYGAQGMTDTPSAFLFFATSVALAQDRVALASALSAANVTFRYEAWLFHAVSVVFLLLYKRDTKGAFLFFLPGAIFIAGWLGLNWWLAGHPLAFALQVQAFVLGEGTLFAHNFPGALLRYSMMLVLSCGLSWIALLSHPKNDLHRLIVATFIAYALFTIGTLYAGANVGWLRHMLYFTVPLAALVVINLGWLLRVILPANAVLGVLGFWSLWSKRAGLLDHPEYVIRHPSPSWLLPLLLVLLAVSFTSGLIWGREGLS